MRLFRAFTPGQYLVTVYMHRDSIETITGCERLVTAPLLREDMLESDEQTPIMTWLDECVDDQTEAIEVRVRVSEGNAIGAGEESDGSVTLEHSQAHETMLIT